MDCEARAFEFPSQVEIVTGVPQRRHQPMTAQAIEVLTPWGLLGAGLMTIFTASRAVVLAMAPIKRDA